MAKSYYHLGAYSDLVDEARRQADLYPLALPGAETQRLVKQTLGFCDKPEEPGDVQVDDRWEKDGLEVEAVSWWVGYGPRTQAWFFKPAGAKGPLPAVLALHDHGGFKYYGKEKIADGKALTEPFMQQYRDDCYGGRAWVNAIAKEGFAVLVHDTFLWGSRKFPLADIEKTIESTYSVPPIPEGSLITPEIWRYNVLTGIHEHMVSKYCNLLGTTMSGVVCHEDRIALNYLLSRSDAQASNVASLGLSGGGNRSAMLHATADRLKAAGIVGLMSTYDGLLDHNVLSHTWMMFPFGLARYGDWPDLAACRAPAPLLVQYDTEDPLFTLEGMQGAHKRLESLFQHVGHPEAYTGQFYPGHHKFDVEMQQAAVKWLKQVLSAA